jgi:hypothetical protein
MKYLLLSLVALALFLAPAAQAADFDLHAAAAVNGAWLDGTNAAFPADFEAGGTVWSSLSPHLSVVGQVLYGFSHSYIREQVGVRVTTSDVLNPNFNTFLGVVYRGGSIGALRPYEWAPDAGFGLKPLADRYPNLALVGEASYGLQSSRLFAQAGFRWTLPSIK